MWNSACGHRWGAKSPAWPGSGSGLGTLCTPPLTMVEMPMGVCNSGPCGVIVLGHSWTGATIGLGHHWTGPPLYWDTGGLGSPLDWAPVWCHGRSCGAMEVPCPRGTLPPVGA